MLNKSASNSICLKGEVGDVFSHSAEILLPGGQHEVVRGDLFSEWKKGDQVVAELEGNFVIREGGIRKHVLKRIVHSGDIEFADTMNKVDSTTRNIDFSVDDLDSLPEVIEAFASEGVIQAFLDIVPGKYQKEVPQHHKYELTYIIYSAEHDERRMEFCFKKENGSMRRLNIKVLQDELKKEKNNFQYSDVLDMILSDLEIALQPK